MSNMKKFSGLFLAVSVVALSGCSGFEQHMREVLPEPQPAYADKQIVVAQGRSVHELSYSGSEVNLSRMQQASLADFLDRTTLEKRNAVLVEEPSARADALTRRRAVEVVRWLERMGYKTDTFVPMQQPMAGRLLVAVDHVTASVPGCPNWEYHKYAAFGANAHPNMGCADRQNLAAMVADPNDLVVGAVPHASQGEAPLRGEVNYRRGEITELDAVEAEGGMSSN